MYLKSFAPSDLCTHLPHYDKASPDTLDAIIVYVRVKISDRGGVPESLLIGRYFMTNPDSDTGLLTPEANATCLFLTIPV